MKRRVRNVRHAPRGATITREARTILDALDALRRVVARRRRWAAKRARELREAPVGPRAARTLAALARWRALEVELVETTRRVAGLLGGLPRCGARTRSGGRCQASAVLDDRGLPTCGRCRLHGGTPRRGADPDGRGVSPKPRATSRARPKASGAAA